MKYPGQEAGLTQLNPSFYFVTILPFDISPSRLVSGVQAGEPL